MVHLSIVPAAPCWPVSPAIYWTGCSPSSMLPPDSCSQPGAPNASPRFSTTFIGCRSRNGFNSVSAFWHTVVLMDQHRYSRCEHLSDSRCGRLSPPPLIYHHESMTLVVPSVQRLTLGDRAFPAAASRAWNSLPPAIRTVSSFTSFRQQLKTHV